MLSGQDENGDETRLVPDLQSEIKIIRRQGLESSGATYMYP